MHFASSESLALNVQPHRGVGRVSIHAPVWGATAAQVSPPLIEWRFQSTRPRGARPRGYIPLISQKEIPAFCEAVGCWGNGPIKGGLLNG